MNRKILVLLGLALFLAPISFVWSGGSQEADDLVTKATKLIEAQKDSDALLIIQQILDRFPDRRDQVVDLQRKIQAGRSVVDKGIEDFLGLDPRDPQYNEKGYAIVQALQKIPNPEKQVKAMIAATAATFKLQVERNRKNQLMDAALAQIRAKNFFGAIATYEGGFEYQKSDFEGGPQAADFKQSFRQLVDTILKSNDAAKQEEASLAAALKLYGTKTQTTNAEPSPAEWLAAVRSVAAVYRTSWQRLQIYQSLADKATTEQANGLKRIPKDDTNEYLRFIQEFMNGPPNAKESQGIAVAYRLALEDNMSRLASPVLGKIKQLRADLSASLDSGSIDRSLAILAALQTWYPVWTDLAFMSGQQVPGENPQPLAMKTLPSPVRLNTIVFWADDRNDRSLVGYLDAFRSRPTLDDADLVALEKLTATYGKAIAVYAKADTDYEAWTKLKDLPAAADPGAAGEVQALDQRLRTWRDKLKTDLIETARTAVRNAGQLQYSGADGRYQTAKAQVATAAKLVREGDAEAKRYPDRAVVGIDQQVGELNAALTVLAAVLVRNRDVAPELKSDAALTKNSKDSTDLQVAIRKLLDDMQPLRAEAQANIAKAKERAQAAEAAVAQVEAAIRRQDDDVAKVKINEADNAFKESLAIWEVPATRDRYVQILLDLQERADAMRVAVAIAFKRKQLTKAENQMTAEQYDEALESIDLAEQKMKAVKPTEVDQEIADAKRLVLIRKNSSNEQVMREADPTFNTIVNYLSLARLDYEWAKANKGRAPQSQVQERLERARQNLKNVLDIKPNNLEARTLAMLILFFEGGDSSGDQIFANIFRDVTNRIGKQGEDQSVVLSDLLALKSIKPNNPALLQAIVRLRIALGLDPNPADAVARKRAQDLYNEANNLFRGTRDSAILAQAIGMLDEAIRLNPNFAEARFLRDNIQIASGGTSSVTLSAADQALYNQILTLVSQGRFPEAYAISQPLANRNPTYPPLVKINAQIKQRLGIR